VYTGVATRPPLIRDDTHHLYAGVVQVKEVLERIASPKLFPATTSRYATKGASGYRDSLGCCTLVASFLHPCCTLVALFGVLLCLCVVSRFAFANVLLMCC
jgi:hypothetical protein